MGFLFLLWSGLHAVLCGLSLVLLSSLGEDVSPLACFGLCWNICGDFGMLCAWSLLCLLLQQCMTDVFYTSGLQVWWWWWMVSFYSFCLHIKVNVHFKYFNLLNSYFELFIILLSIYLFIHSYIIYTTLSQKFRIITFLCYGNFLGLHLSDQKYSTTIVLWKLLLKQLFCIWNVI